MENKESRGKDYLIEEYEEKISERDKVKSAVANPSSGRLLSRHRELESKLSELSNKVYRYERIKEIIESDAQLLIVNLPNSGPKVAYFKSEWSQAGHPEIYYGLDGLPIATFRGVDFDDISPKEFMKKIMEEADKA